MIGKNKLIFSLESIYLLNELLYDSQIVLNSFMTKTNLDKFVLEIHRADYNRKQIVNLWLFKLCLVKETVSKLTFTNLISINYLFKEKKFIKKNKFATIYSIVKDANNLIVIETVEFEIMLKTNYPIELVNIKETNNNYLRIINSTGLDINKWNEELRTKNKS